MTQKNDNIATSQICKIIFHFTMNYYYNYWFTPVFRIILPKYDSFNQFNLFLYFITQYTIMLL